MASPLKLLDSKQESCTNIVLGSLFWNYQSQCHNYVYTVYTTMQYIN